jgi:hypothetical protein
MKPDIVCDGCGSIVRPENNFTTGYGETPDGKKLCYSCCNTQEAAEFSAADTFCCYLSGDGSAATTWPGGKLATVTYKKRQRGGFGGEYWTVDAIAPDGSKWYGRGGGPGMYLRLRRRKEKQKA